MPHVRFNPNRPIGKNTIGKFLPDLAKAAGIKTYKQKTPHTLRQYMITKLANDPNVNEKETARLARHKNIASQAAYIRTSHTSQAAAFNALKTAPSAPTAQPGLIQPTAHWAQLQPMPSTFTMPYAQQYGHPPMQQQAYGAFPVGINPYDNGCGFLAMPPNPTIMPHGQLPPFYTQDPALAALNGARTAFNNGMGPPAL